MSRFRLLTCGVIWVVVVALTGSQFSTAQEPVVPRPGGPYQAADIVAGSRLFAQHCTVCHGSDGDAVVGVDLRTGRFRRAASDDDLRALITNGIPNTAMPPHPFEAAELTQLVAYLRSGAGASGGAVAGNAQRGQAIFEGKGNCQRCHRVGGMGSRLGPDLSTIGAERPADALRQVLVDPAGAFLQVNRSVRAVASDGTVITGRRLNEDMYTVQLIDQRERLRSLDKATLREFVVVTTARMPSYRDTLSSEEIADVVAYLLTLKDSW